MTDQSFRKPEPPSLDPKSQGVLAGLAIQCFQDSERWFGDTGAHNLPHHTLSLAGEVGELANIVKKIDRGSLNHRDPIVKKQLAMEATDVFVYLLNIAAILNIDLYQSYMVVRTNNEKRFGKAADDRRAANNGSNKQWGPVRVDSDD